MQPARTLRPPPQHDEAAARLAAECHEQLQSYWRDALDAGIEDVLGLIREDEDGLFVAAVSRAEFLERHPELAEHLPTVSHPAHEAHPRMPRGAAMWLIIARRTETHRFCELMRITKLFLLKNSGDA